MLQVGKNEHVKLRLLKHLALKKLHLNKKKQSYYYDHQSLKNIKKEFLF